MPRAAGQIDPRKSEAILDAAAALFAELGPAVSMAAIARRAGVSKQTLYNRYPGKAALARALAGRKADAITAVLRTGGRPEEVLAGFAASLIAKTVGGELTRALRSAALMIPEAPEIGAAVYDAGPGESLRRLASWIAEQHEAGVLDAPDAPLAAEMFVGMIQGHAHLRAVLAAPPPRAPDVEARAREVTRRFLRAFAPAS